MIVFFECGRLGNQLFQYATLKELYPKHSLILFGCGELKRALRSVDAKVVEIEKTPSWAIFFLKAFFLVLTKFRLVGTICERRFDGSYSIETSPAFFAKIYLLKASFFQHQDVIKKIRPCFELGDALIESACNWLRKNNVSPADKNLVFVHVRRGDYLAWPTRKNPAVLDKDYYSRTMDRMRASVSSPVFLLLTDDYYYAKDCFGQEPDVLISDNDLLVDLALMSVCSHGILSASSFSWWGGWFSRNGSDGRKIESRGIYFAPKYWGGHRIDEWYPEGFITDWLTYTE